MASTKPALLICRPDSPIGASGVRVGVAEGDEREDPESELPHAIRESETTAARSAVAARKPHRSIATRYNGVRFRFPERGKTVGTAGGAAPLAASAPSGAVRRLPERRSSRR